MKVYALLASNISWEPKVFIFEMEKKLSGKKLLWEVDDLIMEKAGYPPDKPIRFDRFKETSFGVIGIGFVTNWMTAVLAVSYGSLEYLKQDFIESVNKRPGLDPLEGFLDYWYRETD